MTAMASRTVFDYATPFDDHGRPLVRNDDHVFDARGEYLGSIASLVTIYWKNPRTLHYEQDELPDLDARLEGNPHRAAVANIVRHSCRSQYQRQVLHVLGHQGKDQRHRRRDLPGNLSFPPRVSRGSLLQQPVFHEPERTADHRSVRSHGPAAREARPPSRLARSHASSRRPSLAFPMMSRRSTSAPCESASRLDSRNLDRMSQVFHQDGAPRSGVQAMPPSEAEPQGLRRSLARTCAA